MLVLTKSWGQAVEIGMKGPSGMPTHSSVPPDLGSDSADA